MKNRFIFIFLSALLFLAIAWIFKQQNANVAKNANSIVESQNRREVSTNGNPSSSSLSSASQLEGKDSPRYQAAVAEAMDRNGGLPQGEPVLPAPKDQVLDDPREHGGIIIPRSNEGIYVPGEKAQLTVTSGEKSGNLTPNQNGTFPMMIIIPGGEAKLTLTYPDLPAGSKIDLYCPDGGTINGEAKLAQTLDDASSVTVAWKGNQNLGYHSVAAVAGPNLDEKLVRFWVGPRAFADPASAYKN